MKAKKWLWAVTLAGVLASGTEQALAVFGTSEPVAIDSVGSLEVDGHVEVGVWPFVATDEEAGVLLDGEVLFSSVGEARYDWQPQAPGTHVMECRVDGVAVASETVVVKSLAFEVAKEPNPPTEADPNLSITPTARNFGTGGGAYAIVTSGSGTWEASASVGWIALNATSGQAGYPVAYSVGATKNAGARTGYVYVNGHVHTVTQDGLGATISPGSAAFETAGGTGAVKVSSGAGIAWQARANCDWVTVTPTSGKGAGTVTFTVPPMHDVKARQGTLTVAGQTFTVVQTGRRMAIEPMFATCDYLTHAISLAVEALPDTAWSVSAGAGWISVVGASSGRGSGTVRLSIAENPSWLSRAGTVTIGTETFLVTQKGRTALEFGVSPESTMANVEGANGRFEVAATPDLPWSAKSSASWLTISSDARTGAGNGTVTYSAAPNPTLYQRTGKIVVMPGDALMEAKTHTVMQPAAGAFLSESECELAAKGGSCEVWVSVADIVEWQIENTNGWLKVEGQPNRKGPGMVTLQAATNTTVYPRSGTVTIARQPFTVTQKARDVEVGYGMKVFGADGGSDVLPIHADEAVAWTAVASDPTWITIWQGGNGLGNGEVMYIVSPYVGDGDGRTGSITVGDQVVRIIQREQLFPAAQDAVGVAVVLADAADKRLGERIATVEEYDSLRAWIAGKGLDEAAVMESAHVWPSYALGAETLFGNEPDIQIAGFTPETGAIQRSAEGFTWEVRVAVKDGENAVSVDADKIAVRFAASSQPGDWSEAALLPLTVSVKGKDGYVLLFDVTIESGTAAFLRLGSGEAVVVEPEGTDDGGEEVVVPTPPDTGAKYLVVDLSAGWDAAAYPVTYLDEPPNGGFNTDEYKTTKLVLRRIEPGTFSMGGSTQTTLSKPYYVGLFEVTQKQYELVTGSKPSYFSGDKRPVDMVSWDMIRGDSGWPASSAVSADSFMGRLRARTGLGDFDLPTEAQWEYACRAGTTTTYSYGNNADGNYMWWWYNSSSQTHEVGTKQPNPWGLYDMHGNAGEWCLDWDGALSGGTDPKGSSSGERRVLRGGDWSSDASNCTSSCRGSTEPDIEDYWPANSFRLVRTLSE